MKQYIAYYCNKIEKILDYYFILAANKEEALKNFYYRIFTETSYTPEDIDDVEIVEEK